MIETYNLEKIMRTRGFNRGRKYFLFFKPTLSEHDLVIELVSGKRGYYSWNSFPKNCNVEKLIPADNEFIVEKHYNNYYIAYLLWDKDKNVAKIRVESETTYLELKHGELKIKFLNKKENRIMSNFYDESQILTSTEENIYFRKLKSTLNVSFSLALTIVLMTIKFGHIQIYTLLTFYLMYILLMSLRTPNVEHFKKSLTLECKIGYISFIIYNVITLSFGGIFAGINAIFNLVSWKDFFNFGIILPTVVSVVTSLIPVIYLISKFSISKSLSWTFKKIGKLYYI